mgnify:CR=1 FL=1
MLLLHHPDGGLGRYPYRHEGYTLTGEKMKEIQAVNACRRDAVANGMKLEEAMTKWQSMDQLPAELPQLSL